MPGPKRKRAADLRIGISGWTYPPWRGVFFPAKWPQKRELEFASRQVNSIEINGTFYSLQRPSSFQSWYDSTPPGFLFSVKGSRFITHLRRLREVEKPLATFLASGVLLLREKLGPILWQLPPNFRFDPERMETFFKLLPRTASEAAAMVSRHGIKLKDASRTKAEGKRPLRHACEVRHESFLDPDFIHLLREYDIAMVVADTAGKWPFIEDVTSDFVYVRLHGDEKLYVSGYTPKALAEWTRKIRAWSRGTIPTRTRRVAPELKMPPQPRDVFVYFDNDVKVRAPFDAMSLAHRLGLGPAPPSAPHPATIDEEPRTQWRPIRVAKKTR